MHNKLDKADKVEIETWNRRATFELYKDYDDPFFNMTANVDVTALYEFCQLHSLSFSLACLYFSQSTVNSIREFRIRFVDEILIVFPRVESTQTILQDDESFSFCYFEEKKDVYEFDIAGKKAREKYKALNTFDVESDRLDLIYYSVIPWVSFTSFKHATRFDRFQTIPRIVFGKFFEDGARMRMPISVEANHMIMDGIHIGKYFEKLQDSISDLA